MAGLQGAWGAALRGGLRLVDRHRLPLSNGSLDLEGLLAPAEVLRDRWGVPHLYAANDHDLYLAQGLVHAQDRLWQMEVMRRLAAGRLSELFGEVSLDTDRAARTFGFARLGRADLEQVEPTMREALEAYAAGVNACLASPAALGGRPIEFLLLRHRPEPWRPEDSMAIARLIMWMLSHAWYSEIVRAQLIEAVGAEHAAELELSTPPGVPPVLPRGIEFNRLMADGLLESCQGPFLSRGLGSNAWAVASSRSETGHPLLCNDMHLPLSAPGLWHLTHQQAGDLNVTGASLAGVPFVLVGHNAHIAWGMTLAFTDCEDLYIERLEPGTTRYLFRGEWREAQVLREEIRVKGRRGPHVEEVLLTHHGPVISDVVGHPGERLAVQSMALRPSRAVRGWWELNRAADWDAFVDAVRLIGETQLNVTYADTAGNTGYWVTGAVPVRAAGRGMVPAQGWMGEGEWVGEVPFEEMPHALNPQAGLLVNCNQRIVGDDYPYWLGNAWMSGYRAQRVHEVLASKPRITVAECLALQMDLVTIPGRELAARLEGLAAGDPAAQVLLARLRGWDGWLGAESVPGAIYEVLREALVRNLLEPVLGRDLAVRWRGQGFHPLLQGASELHSHDIVAVLRLLEQPDSWWVAQAGGREAWIERSLTEAAAWLNQQLGPDPEGWQWGRIHRVRFAHTLGAQPPLGLVFDVGPYPVGGDTDTPCQSGLSPAQPYDALGAGPSFREIVDLGDLSRSLVIVPPGQSGRLGSPHYQDLAQPWLEGQPIPMLWTREQVERELEGRLVLQRSAD